MVASRLANLYRLLCLATAIVLLVLPTSELGGQRSEPLPGRSLSTARPQEETNQPQWLRATASPALLETASVGPTSVVAGELSPGGAQQSTASAQQSTASAQQSTASGQQSVAALASPSVQGDTTPRDSANEATLTTTLTLVPSSGSWLSEVHWDDLPDQSDASFGSKSKRPVRRWLTAGPVRAPPLA